MEAGDSPQFQPGLVASLTSNRPRRVLTVDPRTAEAKTRKELRHLRPSQL